MTLLEAGLLSRLQRCFHPVFIKTQALHCFLEFSKLITPGILQELSQKLPLFQKQVKQNDKSKR